MAKRVGRSGAAAPAPPSLSLCSEEQRRSVEVYMEYQDVASRAYARHAGAYIDKLCSSLEVPQLSASLSRELRQRRSERDAARRASAEYLERQRHLADRLATVRRERAQLQEEILNIDSRLFFVRAGEVDAEDDGRDDDDDESLSSDGGPRFREQQ